MKFRIRPVRPDEWIVEAKGLFFWFTFLESVNEYYGDTSIRHFRTKDDAERALNDHLAKIKLDRIEKSIKEEQIKLHLKQPTKYLEIDI